MGNSRAKSFSQYWKAWAMVMLRIPPATTLASTTTPTRAAPTHRGAPASAAQGEARSLELRHQVEHADHHDQAARHPPGVAADSTRNSAKSGSV